MLKLNAQTVRNMIDRGELAAVRVGPRLVATGQPDTDTDLRVDLTTAMASAQSTR